MSDSRLFDSTYKLFTKAMDVSARRHNLITTNIANMDTIGYRPVDLDFQKTLKRVMEPTPPPESEIQATHPEHMEVMPPGFHWENGRKEDESDLYHLDTVDIDTEMLRLSSNNFTYRSTIEMMQRKMGLLKHAIAEGGK